MPHFSTVTPGQKPLQVCRVTVAPSAKTPGYDTFHTNAQSLQTRALRIDAADEHLLNGHPARQESRDVGGRSGDIAMSAGFTPHSEYQFFEFGHNPSLLFTTDLLFYITEKISYLAERCQ
jgi:hypothetical protein